MTTPAQQQRFDGLREVVRRRPMTSFVILAFTLSWIAWTPYVVSENGLGLEPFAFPELLGTSQLLGVMPGAYLGPITAAFLVTAATGGRAGLRRWVTRLLKWRVNWLWYVLSVVGVPVALILSSIPFAGGLENIHVPSATVLLAYVPALVLQMLTTGLAEEPGWRDFALPQMQPRYGPMRSTLVIGPIWGLWHLPLFLTEWGGYPDVTWVRVAEFIVSCVFISIVMTWVFNRTGESLPIAMLLHTSVNNFFSVAWSDIFPEADLTTVSTHVVVIAFGIPALVLTIVTRGRLGYSSGAEIPTPQVVRPDEARS